MPAPVEECVGKYTLFASLYVKFFCQPRREAKLAINKYLCISLFFESNNFARTRLFKNSLYQAGAFANAKDESSPSLVTMLECQPVIHVSCIGKVVIEIRRFERWNWGFAPREGFSRWTLIG